MSWPVSIGPWFRVLGVLAGAASTLKHVVDVRQMNDVRFAHRHHGPRLPSAGVRGTSGVSARVIWAQHTFMAKQVTAT